MISCYRNHCVHQCKERCQFTPQADLELKEWFDARQEARGAAAKEDALERAAGIEEWANTPLVGRLRNLLDRNEWDLSERDIVTLGEAIDALEERGIVGAAA